MTDPTGSERPRGRWWKWPLRIALGMAFLAVATVAAVVVIWKLDHRAAAGKFDAAANRLDAAEPGWRFDAMVAAHNAAVPGEGGNSALEVVRIVEELKAAAGPGRTPWMRASELDNARLPNEAAGDALWRETDGRHPACEPGIARLRAWTAATPRGRLPVDYLGGQPIAIVYRNAERLRDVAAVLGWDALRDARGHRPDRALETAAAGLHLVRSVEFEPMPIPYLVRNAVATRLLDSAQQTLAWCPEPGDAALAAVQALARDEADNSLIGPAMRGERASVVKTCELVDRGQIGDDDNPTSLERWKTRFAMGRTALAGAAYAVARFDELLPLLDRPPADRFPAALEYRLPKGDDEGWFGNLALGSVPTVVKSAARHRANCLCAAAGIACERYRLKHGRWPDSLADLAEFGIEKGLTDPFDGQPLRYAKLPDGVAVYSVGENGKDDGGDVVTRTDKPLDVGFRLWNPDKRNVAKD